MKNETGMPLSLKMFGWKTLEEYGIVEEVTDQADGADRLFYQALSEVRRRGNGAGKIALFSNRPRASLYSFSTDQLTRFGYSNYIHITYPIVLQIPTDYLDMIAL